MNKKVVLSVLATAVVASMAASAFAAPKTGLYIGGNVKKFYSNDTLINMTKDARATYKNELKTIGFKNLVYVNFKGQGATIQEMIDLGVKVAMADPLKQSDFLESYGVVQKDGTINGTEVPKVDPVPTGDLKVDSVSANNLKAIKFTLGAEAKESTVTAAGNIKIYSGSNLLSNVTPSLSADEKTIVLTHNANFDQFAEYKVVINGVESKTDSTKKITNYEKTVTVSDTAAPVVSDVKLTSPKTLEVVFSEPIQTGSSAGQFPINPGVLTGIVQVDGIDVYASAINTSSLNSDGKVVLTLGTALTTGAHKVKVAGVKDYAGFPVAAKEFDVNVAVDTVAPSIASAKLLSTKSAEIVFDEPVDNASVQAQLNNNTLFSVEGQAVTSAVAKADGKTYTITWAQDLDKGALVEVVISYKGFKDNYGNTITEAKTFKFTATDDTTPPTISSAVVNADNTVEVTFSEDVTGFGVSDLELYDKDNKKLSNTVTPAPKAIDGVASKKVYTLTIQNGASLSGAHTLKLLKDGVTDLSVRANKNAEQSLAIVLNDKAAPTVTKAEYVNEAPGNDFNSDADVKDSKITIFFNEAMDASTLASKANYILGNVPLSEVVGASLSVASDNKSVTITINRSASETQYVFTANTDLRVLAVKDAAGNTLDSNQLNASLGGLNLISGYNPAPAFGDVVSKVEAIAKNQLKVYAKSGMTFAGIDPNKIKFAENKGAAALVPNLQVAAVSIAADGKSAVLTLNNELSADRKIDGEDADSVANVVSLHADADAITLTNGSKTAVLAVGDGFVAIDKIAPSIVLPADGKLVATGATVAVKFDENVSASAAAAAQALTVRDSEGTLLTPVTKYTASVSNDTITLTFEPGFTDKVSVALANNNVIVDANGNLANDFAAVTSDKEVVTATHLEVATNAVNALFADETKAALADGVDQAAINAAKAKVEALDASAEKTALLQDIDAAQALLDTPEEN